MKSIKKTLCVVLSLIMAFSVMAVAGMNAGAYDQDSGKHYILPAGETITQAAMFAMGETVYGSLSGTASRFYRVVNNSVRDLEFTVRTDKAIEFTVKAENTNTQFTVDGSPMNSYTKSIGENVSAVITLKSAPIGTYTIQIDGTSADEVKTEYSFSAYCSGLEDLTLRISQKTAALVSGDSLVLQLSDISVSYLNYFWESVDDPKTTDIDESQIVTVNEDGIVSVAFPTSTNNFTKTLYVTVRAVFYYSTSRISTSSIVKSCVITAEPADIYLKPKPKDKKLSLGTDVTRTITATTNVKNATVEWESTDPSVATVTKQGVIHTGSTGGITTLIARLKYNGVLLPNRREIELTVDPNVKNVISVSFPEKTATTRVGETTNVTCKITYSDGSTAEASGKNIVFSSSDEKIATVDKSGTIKGVAEGSVTITATVSDGDYVFTDTCDVTILSALPPWIQVLIKPIQAAIQLIKILIDLVKKTFNK